MQVLTHSAILSYCSGRALPDCETQIPLLGSAAHNRTVLLASRRRLRHAPRQHLTQANNTKALINPGSKGANTCHDSAL